MRMKEVTTAWDRAPTDAELNSFYGNAPDTFEIECAIERQTKAIDADDLANVCHEFTELVQHSIMTGDASGLMALFQQQIKTTIARRASAEIYGDVSVLNPSHVTLGAV